MKVERFRKYREPSYPTHEYFNGNRNALSECVPVRWRQKKIVAGAMAAMFLSGITQTQIAGAEGSVLTAQIEEDGTEKNIGKEVRQEARVNVAPLFIHGPGRGAHGCIVNAPPVFLSEADAREIIEEELRRHGIAFENNDVENSGIMIEEKRRRYGYYRRYEPVIEPTGEKMELVIDGMNEELNLCYEFVSGRDYSDLGGSMSSSSVQRYDFIGIAENLRNKFVEYGKVNAVVFYEPAISCMHSQLPDFKELDEKEYADRTMEEKKRYKDAEKVCRNSSGETEALRKTRLDSKELLRDQVRDYIDWLAKNSDFEMKGIADEN